MARAILAMRISREQQEARAKEVERRFRYTTTANRCWL